MRFSTLLLAGCLAAGHALADGNIKGHVSARQDWLQTDGDDAGQWFEGAVEGQTRHEAWEAGGLLLGRYRSAYRHTDPDNAADLERELRAHEAWLGWQGDSSRLRLGRQQITWGQGDYFRVLDVFNPLDLREFLLPYLDDFALGRVTREMAVFDHQGETLEQQWVVGVDRARTRLAPSGTPFAMTALPPLPVLDNEPAQAVDIGWRGRFQLGDTDLALHVFEGWHPDTFYQLTPSFTLSASAERRRLLGLAFARPMGDWVLRGDLARGLREPVATLTGPETVRQTQALLGLDYSVNDWTWNLQASVRALDDTPVGLLGPGTAWDGSIGLRKEWPRLRLGADALVLAHHEGNDGALWRLGVWREVWTNTRLRLSAVGFGGQAQNQYGQFDNQDRVQLELRHHFAH